MVDDFLGADYVGDYEGNSARWSFSALTPLPCCLSHAMLLLYFR